MLTSTPGSSSSFLLLLLQGAVLAMTNETSGTDDPLQQALNEAEQLMSDLNVVTATRSEDDAESSTAYSSELLSKEAIGGFSIDDDDDDDDDNEDGAIDTIDLMHPLHESFLNAPPPDTSAAVSAPAPLPPAAPIPQVHSDSYTTSGMYGGVQAAPNQHLGGAVPPLSTAFGSHPLGLPSSSGQQPLADAFKSTTSKFASNLANFAQRAATQVAAQGAAAAASLNATAAAPPVVPSTQYAGSSVGGISTGSLMMFGSPGGMASTATNHATASATNAMITAAMSWDKEQKQALLEEHVGQLLPGESVIMFLTNLMHVEYHSTCFSTATLFANATAGQALWCCVMTYYRLILFATATPTTDSDVPSAPGDVTSQTWRNGWNAACLPPSKQAPPLIEIPLACIDKVEKSVYSSTSLSPTMPSSSQVGLRIHSKLGETVRFSTLSYADTKKAQEALSTYAFPGRRNLGYLFAFESKRQAVMDSIQTLEDGKRVVALPPVPSRFVGAVEFERQLQGNLAWTVSTVNAQYQICANYPSVIVGPSTIPLETAEGMAVIRQCAAFRSEGRWPCLTWASSTSGASLWRASQPKVGLQGNRSSSDELYLQHILDCAAAANNRNANKPQPLSWSFLQLLTGSLDLAPWVRPSALLQPVATDGSPAQLQEQHVLKILDLRPKSSAMANRTGGYGYENTSHYPGTTIQFCGIGNIHAVRDSFQKLTAVTTSPRTNDLTWQAAIEDTKWLSHIRLILAASWESAFWIHVHQLPVLLHCSHGWDRTAQVAVLAQLLLDPFYRTVKGFAMVVEKDFMAFGHPFHTRCSHGEGKGMTDVTSVGAGANATSFDDGQVSPIFLQFLDCVYQIVSLFPECFEFNTKFLLVLSEHIYSCRFGNFLCDTERERELVAGIRQRTHCLWDYLESREDLFNSTFDESKGGSGVLLMPLPSLLRNVHLWSDRHCRYSPKTTSRWLPEGSEYSDSRYPTAQELQELL